MVSEASWQTGVGRHHGGASAEGPMDQQSVESLLRRLVERVEESERRYSEALDELHARLDQLSQTTDAARTSDDAETFGRLHDQVSSLARRLEGEASTPLDDFERLGRALAGDLDHAASLAGGRPSPDLLDDLAAGRTPFAQTVPEPEYSAPFAASHPTEHDLDQRLIEMARRFEHSIGAAMPPQALEALSARLDEIGKDIAKALADAPKGQSFEPLEQKISDMAQQLSRAETQLAKIGEIDTALRQLIERVDAAPSPEEVANKAAQEAARLVADEAKLSAGAADRLDAMHRDLVAMNDRTRASDDKLAGTIAAVHESLKELVQQIEKNALPAPAPAPKPRVPFAERMRGLAPLPDKPAHVTFEIQGENGETPTTGQTAQAAATEAAAGQTAKDAPPKEASAKVASPRNRLAAAIADLEDAEDAPHFGRAKRVPDEDKPFDLDAPAPRRSPAKKMADAEYEAPDDLLAAARRAAQAAALKAEERSSGSRLRRLPGDAETVSGAEMPSRRKRSFLIISAAILLAISALLLYSRLRSKPEVEVEPIPPAVEQSAPTPAAPSENATPGDADNPPAAVEPKVETPPAPNSSELQLEQEVGPAGTLGDAAPAGNVTDVPKSSYRNAVATEPLPVEPASLKPTDEPQLPPGVVFSVGDPAVGAPTAALPMPTSLPLPPPDLGPLALRQAAAQGDARAQFAIAFRYVEGNGTPQNLTEAARWLERAASAGLALAQYRLAVMYERGQGVTKDLGRARSWYQAAAEKGNIKAMHNLAVSASGRQAGSADYALAVKWYGEAAAHGLADSQFNLGILAEHGLGAPKNLAEAYKWFALAAKAGDQEAAKRRDLVKAELAPAELQAGEQAIAAWTAKAPVAEANGVDERAEWADASPTPNTALVSRAQNLLNKLGYDVGAPDGLMGAKTRDAIKSFERKNGLQETGTVTIPLVAKLERLTS
jgi:localization factor PodJL